MSGGARTIPMESEKGGWYAAPEADERGAAKAGSAAGTKRGKDAKEDEGPSTLHRTVGAIRHLVPTLQKVLPLLDGNVILALANLLGPKPEPPVDLEPVETGLKRMRIEHEALRGTLAEQTTGLKRLGDQIRELKEAGERHETEQKELREELRRARGRIIVLGFVGLLLLATSLGMNVLLLLRVEQLLR